MLLPGVSFALRAHPWSQRSPLWVTGTDTERTRWTKVGSTKCYTCSFLLSSSLLKSSTSGPSLPACPTSQVENGRHRWQKRHSWMLRRFHNGFRWWQGKHVELMLTLRQRGWLFGGTWSRGNQFIQQNTIYPFTWGRSELTVTLIFIPDVVPHTYPSFIETTLFIDQ